MNQEILTVFSFSIIIALSILLNIKISKAKALKSLLQLKDEEYTNNLNQKVKENEEFVSTLNMEINELSNSFKNLNNQYSELNKSYAGLEEKYGAIIDKDKEVTQRIFKIEQLQEQLNTLNEKYKKSLQLHTNLEKQIDLYNDTLEIGAFGLYKPQYSFDLPEQYKLELEYVYQQLKAKIAAGTAVECKTEWTVQGSKAEGKKMTNRYMKLMLYAFNGESDALISKVKWNNASKIEERIRHAYISINKLGESHTIHITAEYLNLKLKELALTFEYEVKKQEEKEEQKRIREQMREEERAQKEFERAERDAEDEERRYQKSLEKAKKELGLASKEEMEALNQKIGELEQNLQEARERKERAISLAQQTKVGHIYVISNIGSFGEDVYKIGMTRRLDPLDRIKELGDASVPFQFDVHAIIYSENAPHLEYELHKRFNEKRLNRINGRKEFFKISLNEIENFIIEHTNAEIQFTKLAEAKEFRETLNLLERMNKVLNPTPEPQKFPESLFS